MNAAMRRKTATFIVFSWCREKSWCPGNEQKDSVERQSCWLGACDPGRMNKKRDGDHDLCVFWTSVRIGVEGGLGGSWGLGWVGGLMGCFRSTFS